MTHGEGDRCGFAIVQSPLESTLDERTVDQVVTGPQFRQLKQPLADQSFQSLPTSVSPGLAHGQLPANVGRHEEGVRKSVDDGGRARGRVEVDDHAGIGHDRDAWASSPWKNPHGIRPAMHPCWTASLHRFAL